MITFKIKYHINTRYIKSTKKMVIKTVTISNLQQATKVVSELIRRRKEEYQNHLALKLSDLMTNTKTF